MGNTAPDAIRARLTNKYVGHAGIYGVGVRMRDTQPVIYVYVDPEYELQHGMLQDLKADARPYKVNVVRERPPAAI